MENRDADLFFLVFFFQLEAFANSRAASPLPSSTRIPSYSSSTPLASTSSLPALLPSNSNSSSTSTLPALNTPSGAAPPPSNQQPSSLLKVALKPPHPTPVASPAPAPTHASTPTPPPPKPPLPTRSSLAYKKSVSASKQIPLIPNFVFDRVLNYVAQVKGVTKKREVVGMICRYWSLKREARRGAPLLKRIHLEPWTASASSRLQSDSDRASKLQVMKLLRQDLEKVRTLTEQVRNREKKKLERLEWFEKEILNQFVWPKQTRLKLALQEIVSLDKSQYYLNPVDPKLVPDYHEIIKSPMDWTTMSQKLDRHEYETALDFQVNTFFLLSLPFPFLVCQAPPRIKNTDILRFMIAF